MIKDIICIISGLAGIITTLISAFKITSGDKDKVNIISFIIGLIVSIISIDTYFKSVEEEEEDI